MFKAMGTWGLPWVLVLTGCGSFEQEQYDITLDEAQAQAVPYACTDKTVEDPEPVPGTGGPSGLTLQQRWTVRAERFGATSLEVPDFAFTLPGGDLATIDDDGGPDVLDGTTSESGPFQYIDIRTRPLEDEAGTSVNYVVRFYIANDSLEDDTIDGFIDVRRTTYTGAGADAVDQEECTSKVRFTGRRVK
ncbi:hypothetical protein ACN469_14040 [Corallococcus terminator]